MGIRNKQIHCKIANLFYSVMTSVIYPWGEHMYSILEQSEGRVGLWSCVRLYWELVGAISPSRPDGRMKVTHFSNPSIHLSISLNRSFFKENPRGIQGTSSFSTFPQWQSHPSFQQQKHRRIYKLTILEEFLGRYTFSGSLLPLREYILFAYSVSWLCLSSSATNGSYCTYSRLLGRFLYSYMNIVGIDGWKPIESIDSRKWWPFIKKVKSAIFFLLICWN